ncbi:hypothetical protein SAMN02910384_02110 [Pseudobutyrivibrio sp. ACV-2]|nr:hypothetical protein SAMN02910384_02110 [Pseudobutyrivibrio sp. ACV-2]
MLSIYFGDLKDSIYNTSSYFKFNYEKEWLTDSFVSAFLISLNHQKLITKILPKLLLLKLGHNPVSIIIRNTPIVIFIRKVIGKIFHQFLWTSFRHITI